MSSQAVAFAAADPFQGLVSDATPAHIGQLSTDGRWRWDGTAWQPVYAAPPPVWATARIRGRATWAGLVTALLVGILADQALRNAAIGLAASLTFIAGAAALVTIGLLRHTESRLLVGAAALLACFFTLRASPWLLWPDLIGAVVLLGAAASFAVRGSIADVGAAEMMARSFQAAVQVMAGVGYVSRPAIDARARVSHAAPLIRGVLIAIPIAALLAGLLASADAVFASFFKLNIDVGPLVTDVLLVAGGGL